MLPVNLAYIFPKTSLSLVWQFIALMFGTSLVIGLFLYKGLRFLKEASNAIGELLRDVRGECLEGEEDKTIGRKVDRLVTSLEHMDSRITLLNKRHKRQTRIIKETETQLIAIKKQLQEHIAAHEGKGA